MDNAKPRQSMKNRRVSFSDKASIRVFERDDGASQFRKQLEGGEEKATAPPAAPQQKTPLKLVSTEDKENVFVPSVIKVQKGSMEANVSVLCTTTDFIEKSIRSSDVHIENSVDFTLLSTENNPQRIPDLTFFASAQEVQLSQNMKNKVNETTIVSPVQTELAAANETWNNLCSPEFGNSPLVPPEYGGYGSNRKLTLRQLNDDLEQGKIQIYPDVVQPPASGSKKKCAITLFDDSAMSLCSPQTKPMARDRTPRQQTKKNIRFSEADDMLFNNTSYLTQAVLGDETVACNLTNAPNVLEKSPAKPMVTEEDMMPKAPMSISQNVVIEDQDGKQAHPLEEKHCEEPAKAKGLEAMKQQFDTTVEASYHPQTKAFPPERRNTLHFHEEMQDIESETQGQQVETETKSLTEPSKGKRRETIHFDEVICAEDRKDENAMDVDTETDHMSAPIPPLAAVRRQTLHFNEAISPDERHSEEAKDIPTEMNTAAKRTSALKRRETLHLNEGICPEGDDAQTDNLMVLDTSTNPPVKASELKRRHTMHLNEAISEELTEAMAQTAKESVSAQSNRVAKSSVSRRETIHFNEEIGEEKENEIDMEMATATMPLPIQQQRVAPSRRVTLQFNEVVCEEMTNTALPQGDVVELPKAKPRHTMHFNEGICVESTAEAGEVRQEEVELEAPAKSVRHTLHFYEAIDEEVKEPPIAADDSPAKVAMPPKNDKFITRVDNMSFDMDVSSEVETSLDGVGKQPSATKLEGNATTGAIAKRRVTMHMNEAIGDEELKAPTVNPLRYIPAGVAEGKMDDSLQMQLVQTRAVTFSNKKGIIKDNISPVLPATPGRIEFEHLEREARLAQLRSDQKKRRSSRKTEEILMDVSGLTPLNPESGHDSPSPASPIVREDTHKRPTLNLTPNLPIAKKRQTVMFNDTISNCSIQEARRAVPKTSTGLPIHPPTFNDRLADISGLPKPPIEDVDQSLGCSHLKQENDGAVGKAAEPILCDSVMEISHCPDPIEEPEAAAKTETVIHGGSMMDITKMPRPAAAGDKSRVQNSSKVPKMVELKNKSAFIAVDDIESEVRSAKPPLVLPNTDLIVDFELKDSPPLVLPYTDLIVDFEFKDSLSQAPSIYEDNPITVSDVSAHFLAVRRSQGRPVQAQEAASSEEQENVSLDGVERGVSPRFSNEQNTIHNVTNFKNNYMDLTDVRPMLESDDIDKTCLSLVGALEDECATVDESKQPDEVVKAKDQPPAEVVPPLQAVATPRNRSMCYKCKRCQDTLTNDTTIDLGSFVMPKVESPPDLGMAKLRRLRAGPKLADILLSFDNLFLNDSLNVSEMSSFNDTDSEQEDDAYNAEAIIAKYKEDTKKFEMDLMKTHAIDMPVRQQFVYRLEALLRDLPGWIFDYQMQARNILVCHFKRIKTFVLTIAYEEVDSLGFDVIIKTIRYSRSTYPEKNWKPMDYILDFQLKLELPINLKSWCHGNTEQDVFRMLEKIDQVCGDVYRMCMQMWRTVVTEQALLVRDGNRSLIRKTLRNIVRTPDDRHNTVSSMEFEIEVLDLKTIGYKSIVYPQLHQFREELQLLPQGFGFLKEFLKSPDKHLKSTTTIN